MNVIAVTVTYGNRYKYVEGLIEKLLMLGVQKIVIVDNGSENESKINLVKLCNIHSSKVRLISLLQNLGSAGGFKKGIEFAESQGDCEYIWLLDDDNLPDHKALTELIGSWKKFQLNNSDCLLCLRKDRYPYDRIYNEKDVENTFPPFNSFLSFNILFSFKKKLILNKSKKRKNHLIALPYAPYGGMFFHKNILKTIGYPLEELYLYRDDHEFSRRIVEYGFKIYLNRKSIVEEIETSWYNNTKYFAFNNFMSLINGEDSKTFYTIRNSIYFERKYMINNTWEYFINKSLFKFIYFLLCIALNKTDRISLLKKALIDSKNIKLT